MAASKDFTILQGKTFSQVLRWEAPPIIYKAITNVLNTAPARIEVPDHDIPPLWRVAITGVKGPKEINAENSPPRDRDYHQATVIDANTIDLNAVNAADFKAYTSGGYVQFNTPVDMTGYTARMSIKDRVGGTELLRLDTTNGRIAIDNTNKTITLTIDADDTEAITWKRGAYDLEMVSAGGQVTCLLTGSITVTREVTTS